jgi:TRAP-type C4-dicarboxylate transport system permease small subunit
VNSCSGIFLGGACLCQARLKPDTQSESSMTGDSHPSQTGPATAPDGGRIHLDEEAEEEAISTADVQWDDIPAFILFWVLAAVVFIQFFTRYVLNSSLGWTEEIARYLLIGVAFIGSVMVTRKGSHIAIEIFYLYMPRPLRRVLSTLVDVILVGVYGWFAWLASELAGRTHSMMVSIDLPKSIIYWTVAVGFAGMAIYQLVQTVSHLRSGTSGLIDPPGS